MATAPVRLLVFAHALQGRGTERALVRLLAEFDRDVIVPILVVASARGEFLASVPADVEFHDLQITGRTSSAIPALEKLIRRVRPDCTMGVHISAGRVLCALKILHPKLPVICMEADPFTRIEGDKGNLGLRRRVSRITYRLATRIAAASDVVAQDLIANLGVSSRKISIIPLPSVDDSVLEMAQASLEDPPFHSGQQEPIIVTIGNMFPHKDQATLLKAFAMIVKEVPSHLVLIGEGPARPELEALAKSLGVSDRVWFVGFQKNPFRYLSRSLVFVSPSAAEGFDISQIEAMACGLPVVVTDAPRFRAVEDERTGLLVPPGNPTTMAGTVLRVLRSKKLASKLGRNAMEAAQEYTSQKIARRYEELIASIVRGD